MSRIGEDYRDPRDMEDCDDDSDFWAWVHDMEADAELAEREVAKADARLDAERDAELLAQLAREVA
jgi:hypothetical protein